mmetsp:Transcript_46896/g.90453  ORF Transcript_46896/g.90453 Transcript_46896/m.90453 type:complete len:104 (-) Transcript_46896:118-429(-)
MWINHYNASVLLMWSLRQTNQWKCTLQRARLFSAGVMVGQELVEGAHLASLQQILNPPASPTQIFPRCLRDLHSPQQTPDVHVASIVAPVHGCGRLPLSVGSL